MTFLIERTGHIAWLFFINWKTHTLSSVISDILKFQERLCGGLAWPWRLSFLHLDNVHSAVHIQMALPDKLPSGVWSLMSTAHWAVTEKTGLLMNKKFVNYRPYKHPRIMSDPPYDILPERGTCPLSLTSQIRPDETRPDWEKED